MVRCINTSKSNDEKAGFWAKLNKPFFTLAPMANVTDAVFRRLFAKYGKPDVTWTEFVSADGLMSVGKNKLLTDLMYTEKERPIVAQIFGCNPATIEGASRLIKDLGFDGIDINMGCPDRAVLRQGGGASLINNPDLAISLIKSARAGADDKISKKSKVKSSRIGKVGNSIPVSVKTRIGFNKIDLSWIETLLKQNLPALTVHLRTKKEMSDVPAHWEIMPKIVEMRDKLSPETLIIGNGDISSISEAKDKARKSGCDGVMIGRGVFGKPWFFGHPDVSHPGVEKRLKILMEHTKLFEKTFKGKKSFEIMKKHFKAYVSGWDGAKELRVLLMGAHSYEEVERIIKQACI